MVGVALKDVSKHFGDVKAVDSVNLEIKDKEFITLLGPSGCGKTTTLRLIAGLETLTKGEIYIGERLVNDLPPKDRDIAMVFQSYALYPHMSVYDNIAFPLKIRKLPKEEIEKKVKYAAELLGIARLLKRKPKELSGGERQRVALGRAIVRNPQVFLMDEPLSNLDAKLRVYMRAELIRLQKMLATTLIYVTHDQVEAMTMSNRIAIMNHGRLIQVAPPNIIYINPADTFVAGFIGSPPMNFIDCTYTTKDNQAYLDAGTFHVEITKFKDLIEKEAKGSEMILGVRPEDITVYREKPPSEHFEAEVYAVEPLGSEIIINLKIGESIIKAKGTPEFKAEMGDRLHLTMNKEKIHIFDRATGRAII
ncbi:MAG: ABC transporter ATP-binding protein [Candidatus Bathyarchaeia archaeon]